MSPEERSSSPEELASEGPSSSEGRVSEVMIDGIRMWSIEVQDPKLPDSLTAAEQEVVELVLQGRSNQEIASARATSSRTVGNQLASIYQKLGVNSRAELASRLNR